jgi:hypothetical protein
VTTRTINLGDAPVRPTNAQLDDIMRSVSEQLGETWSCVRFSGYWLFYQGKPSQVAPCLKSRRQFAAALSQATGCGVVQSIKL